MYFSLICINVDILSRRSDIERQSEFQCIVTKFVVSQTNVACIDP